MQKNRLLPLNIQFFGEKDGNQQTGNGGTPPAGQDGSGQGAAGGSELAAGGQIDYQKIQKMLDGTLAAKEDVALKNYFKQQGLSQQEAEQAIAAFKAEKAKSQPDTETLLKQVQEEKELRQKANIENTAMLAAVSLGLDAKTIPYVLKMADLSGVIGQDGKINEETVKAAINKVLEDVPQLKPAAAGNSGFQIGGSGGSGQNTATEEALKSAFGIG